MNRSCLRNSISPFGDVAAEEGIFQEVVQTRFHRERRFRFQLDKVEPPYVTEDEVAVQEDFDAECHEVDVPVSMRGSRIETQFSAETWNTSVSRNSSSVTLTCS